MRGRTRWIGALWLVAGLGCEAPEPLEGGLVVGTVDAYRLCDVNGVEVRLLAQWQECVADEPECEPPADTTIAGDRFSCPSAEATRQLGVELASAGVYRIEVSTAQASGPARVECFVDPDSGDDRVELSATRLQEGPPKRLDEHRACP